MSQAQPLSAKDVLQLTEKGIDKASIVFKNVTLQSSKYICVREEGKTSVAVIDTATKNVLRLPVAVDSAIMNPISKVIALRAQNNLQIYNLEMKTKMKQTTISADEQVVFWKWIDPKTIAIVTGRAVLHWSMDGDQQPQKMFDRAEQGQVQIINYRSSADGKWLILGGIAQDNMGGIKGVLQVYSVEMKTSQKPMDAHAACFASVTVDGRSAPSTLFCFTSVTDQGPKLNVLEVGVAKEQALKVEGQMRFQQGDFPVGMLPDKKLGVLYILTKMGFLFIHEIQSGKCIFGQQVSKATMFAQIESDSPEGGIVTVDQTGSVRSFCIDQKTVVPYVCNQLNDFQLGVTMAKRYGLPGAEGYLGQQFTQLMQSQRYNEAMELAASSPQGVLRTTETINQFKNVTIPGQQPGQMLLQYFTMLLNKGSLNAIESIELAGPVLRRKNEQGLEHIKGWLKDNKLAATEELGDLLKNYNVTLALSVYLRANVSEKVIGCFLTLAAQEQNETQSNEHLNNILGYATKFNFSPDYPALLSQLMQVNSERAKDFALLLINHPDGAKVDVNATVDAFMRQNDVKHTTFILLEYLKARGNNEEDAMLQTRLLEINLLQMPKVAEAIMDSDEYNFSHYDKTKIATLCERAQLYQKALEHYTDLSDIKRVLTNSAMINAQFLLEYFGRMSEENCLELLRDLLKFNLQANIRLVVEVAKKWSGEKLSPDKLIELFEEFKSHHGIYFYLGSFVNTTCEDSTVVFKYIEAAVKLNQLKVVEAVCRDHNHYDPKEVKEFLLSANLKDPRPLIHVCDRFGYVDELTGYLYTNNMKPFIEAYVQRMNPKACPSVVGSLLDMNANEDQILKLLDNVVPPHDDPEFVDKLVAAVEHRNRLKLLRPFLEARNKEGSEDPYVHNGLAKIYVDVNNQPASFLQSNKFYDSAVVGEYCESRDPHLAFIAYKRAGGACDDALIEVSNKNGFFKDQAKYLVERQDADLWERVLDEEKNEFRRQLIDQVVATALPESRAPEEVSSTVKAFMHANLPNELIELLERLILHGNNSDFNSNKNLQNLLILTAIKADTPRVMNYIKQLENFDGPEIAQHAIKQAELYEEAWFIYRKFKKGPESIGVVLDQMDDVDRAVDEAEYWDQPEVWSILAKAQLNRGQVAAAIKSYLKAEDSTAFNAVIAAAKSSETFNELITFLQMARKNFKDANIDGEMIYCFAKTEKLAELEEFINAGQVAKITDCGDRCFGEGLYQAAKILYNHVNNYSKLAVCLVKLGSFTEAVNAAKNANAIPTWKEVCFACVEASEFRLAQMCGINVLAYNEHLKDVIKHYETLGHFDEIILMLEQGINTDRAQQALYTQLGVLYAKYKEEKLMEHIKLFWSKLNIPTLLSVCQENYHYTEAVFLYSHYDQFDNAIDLLINNSASCWKHELFKETIKQVANIECYYKGIIFYLEERPTLLNDLLVDLIPQNLDPTRVVNLIKPTGHLPLVMKYLLAIQRENVAAVNEAVHNIYVEEENYTALSKSIQEYDQMDQVALAMQLENHELIEFRRISAKLFKLNKRWDRSFEISKKDELWSDCMQTVAASKDVSMAENLLEFFVKGEKKECFAACLFTCYDLIRPDLILEIAWRHNMMDFAMPFMIQTFSDFNAEVKSMKDKFNAQDDAVKADEEEKRKLDEQQQQTDAAYVGHQGDFNPMNTPLALAPPPGAYGYQQNYGNMGMQQGGMGMQQGGMGMQQGGMQQGGFYQ